MLVLEFPGGAAELTLPSGTEAVLDPTGVLAGPAAAAPCRRPVGPSYGRTEWLEIPAAVLRRGFTDAERASLQGGIVLPLSPALFLEQRIRGGVPRVRSAETTAFITRVLREGLNAAHAHGPATPRQRRLAARIRREVAACGARPIRLAELARALDCSLFHLVHTFRRVEHTTICAHQARLRLCAAAMKLTESPVADLSGVALDFGFSSHSHFTAAFRRAFAVTPSVVAGVSRRVAC